ncbi:hypothetical protein CKAN_02174500 [Cinnamomum micranthum f. kanehirae]|uniref:Uncharacterized protein n=1 Tax=Cinnamomum micranthum f. kanehirae TaxID=337451 RepID=A0A443PP26_9MAGN|nr:hypothetical protein CKAN_02174500 [Cinnamomum micranthum f. kanehirae]
MTFLDYEEPKSPPVLCKFIPSSLKDAFAQCYALYFRRQSSLSAKDESPASDVEDERVIVLAVRTRTMRAKLRRKDSMRSNSFRWVFSPATGEVFITTKGRGEEEEEFDDCKEEDGHESFFSARSHFSHSCSSLTGIDYYQQVRRRLILEELAQCEGWPFGLCRKALLLPPLPRSPSESWTWCSKGNPIVKMPSST